MPLPRQTPPPFIIVTPPRLCTPIDAAQPPASFTRLRLIYIVIDIRACCCRWCCYASLLITLFRFSLATMLLHAASFITHDTPLLRRWCSPLRRYITLLRFSWCPAITYWLYAILPFSYIRCWCCFSAAMIMLFHYVYFFALSVSFSPLHIFAMPLPLITSFSHAAITRAAAFFLSLRWFLRCHYFADILTLLLPVLRIFSFTLPFRALPRCWLLPLSLITPYFMRYYAIIFFAPYVAACQPYWWRRLPLHWYFIAAAVIVAAILRFADTTCFFADARRYFFRHCRYFIAYAIDAILFSLMPSFMLPLSLRLISCFTLRHYADDLPLSLPPADYFICADATHCFRADVFASPPFIDVTPDAALLRHIIYADIVAAIWCHFIRCYVALCHTPLFSALITPLMPCPCHMPDGCHYTPLPLLHCILLLMPLLIHYWFSPLAVIIEHYLRHYCHINIIRHCINIAINNNTPHQYLPLIINRIHLIISSISLINKVYAFNNNSYHYYININIAAIVIIAIKYHWSILPFSTIRLVIIIIIIICAWSSVSLAALFIINITLISSLLNILNIIFNITPAINSTISLLSLTISRYFHISHLRLTHINIFSIIGFIVG